MVIFNGVFLVFIFNFYHLERITRKILKRSKICCAIFFGQEIVIIFCVNSWVDCCAKRYIVGLQLVDPKEIVDAFMTKWVVCVLEASDSNLKSLLNHQSIVVSPNKLFRWEKTLNGLLLTSLL
jgi:hypothetical protein